MGNKDIISTRYMKDEVRYADLLNVYLFHGEQRVKPEDLVDMDPRVNSKSEKRRKHKGYEYRQRTLDMVRKVVFGTGVAIVSLENQDKIHYGMPIRTMVEDSFGYNNQMETIQKKHRSDKDLVESAEKMGHFSKDDRILPSITIVIYYGKDEWDGARNLLDLMDMQGVPPELQKMVNGYELHLLEVRKFADVELFRSDLREVFGAIQCAGDKEKVREFIDENEHNLKQMGEDALDMIREVAEITMPEKYGNKDGKEDENMNLCQGIKDWIADERMEGKKEGKLSGKSEALLLFLTQLGTVPESLENRIMREQEIAVLEKWIGIVPHVKSVEEFIVKM